MWGKERDRITKTISRGSDWELNYGSSYVPKLILYIRDVGEHAGDRKTCTP